MKPILSRRNAAHCRGVLLTRSTPATTTLPRLGVSMAPIRFSSVVLPLPDGPRRTTNSPADTASEDSASTVVRIAPWSYHLLTSESRITGAEAGGVGIGAPL